MTYETDIVRNPDRCGKGRGNRNGSLPRDYLHASGPDVIDNATRHALWRAMPSGGWLLAGVRTDGHGWQSPASVGQDETLAIVPSGMRGWWCVVGLPTNGPHTALRMTAARAVALRSFNLSGI